MSNFHSRVLACLCASSLSLIVAGCGMGAVAPSGPELVALPAIQGVVHGGSQPIIGATVNLYVTVAGAGYGGTASNLAHVTTGSYGQFSFPANAYTYANVDSTQYAYMTVVGGNAGTSGANSNILLMAALGSAASLTSQSSANAVQVYISEASTVAAAYALSNFITDTSGIVNVAAPTNNSATSAACVSGYAMTCTASGLGHAFANASNLVTAAGTTTSPTAGLANSTLSANANASVPQALINYLANALTACTNSTGGVATNTATSCGALFAATTPPGGTAPTDTLQAAINMAKYPTNNVNLTGTNTCTTTPAIIACIPAPSAPFQPSLSAAPKDLSMAIVYSISPATGTTTAPYFLALDAQDNVFVAVKDSTPSSGVAGLTSNGTPLFPYTQNNSTLFVTPFAIATDNIGHVWLTDNGAAPTGYTFQIIRGFYTGAVTGTTAGNVYTVINGTANTVGTGSNGAGGTGNNPALYSNGTPGAVTPATPGSSTSADGTLLGIGVDRANGIWVCRKSGQSGFRFSFAAGTSGTSPDTYTDVGQSEGILTPGVNAYFGNFSTGCTDVKFDNFQDAVLTGYLSGGQTGILSNTTQTTATPTYQAPTGTMAPSVKKTVSTSVGSSTGVGPAGSTTGVNSGIVGGSAVTANTGTAGSAVLLSYLPAPTGIFLSTFTGTATPTLTLTGPVMTATLAVESYPEFDGGGVLWVPNNSSTGNLVFGTPGSVATPTTAQTLAPCYLPAAATTCTTNSAASYTNVLQVDSTGSIWTISQNNSGVITQIIGTASPTWPAMYYATYATKPQ